MSKITITEALQEIKTIGKRLERKRQSVLQYIVRDSRIRDPLEKDGGSEKFIAGERQGIADLEARVISIRTAIQRSNLDSQMTVGGKTMSVADWLTWRREISAQSSTFLRTVSQSLTQTRAQIQQKGGKMVAAAIAVNESVGPNDPPHVLVNLDERKLMDEQEQMEHTLGDLDGKLSLFNATSVIELN